MLPAVWMVLVGMSESLLSGIPHFACSRQEYNLWDSPFIILHGRGHQMLWFYGRMLVVPAKGETKANVNVEEVKIQKYARVQVSRMF